MADFAIELTCNPQAFVIASSSLHALVEGLGRHVTDRDRVERRGRVLDAIVDFPLPSALFGGIADGDPIVNAGWRTLCGGALPVRVRTAVEVVITTHRVHRISELAVALPSYRGVFDVTVLPVRTEPAGALAVCIEITHRVLARELDLDDAEPMWCGSSAEIPAYYSPTWRTTIARDWKDAIDPRDAERVAASARGVEASRLPDEIEARLIRANGESRWHRIRLIPHLRGIVGTARDIDAERRFESERRELLAEAQSARTAAAYATQLKDEFLSAISHELRSPVATMMLWEKVLRDNADDDDMRRRALDAIHQSAVAQARLVGDLLDVSRVINGKLELRSEVVDVADLVGAACEAVRPLAGEKSIELSLQATKTALVDGDPTRLRQIVDNLLTNAIKFTPSGGRVRVSVRRGRRNVAVDVHDTGRGIAPELLAKIFDPFKQADDGPSHREGGLGLGLTIAKQLADRHRGTLIARSDGLDRGACFTLTLPTAARKQMRRRCTTPRVPALDGLRVLVIDADPQIRDALWALLEQVGLIVDTADSSAMGRARMAALEPHAVICDIVMPDEDGYAFMRWLRASGVSTPAIALTALATQLDIERALDAGFDRHLAKPVTPEHLVETLAEVLAARAAPETIRSARPA